MIIPRTESALLGLYCRGWPAGVASREALNRRQLSALSVQSLPRPQSSAEQP
jgi:hypothetical protein